MKRALVFFTDYYPFAVGEEFIEQEIAEVCRRFDQVIVIPVRVRQGEAQQTRPLPKNARAILCPPSLISDWRFQTICRFPQALWLSPQLYQVTSWSSRVRALIDARFAGTVLELFSKLRQVLPKQTFSRFDSVVFYGYWLHTPAALAALSRRFLLQSTTKGVAVSRAHAYDVDEKDNRYGYLPARHFLLNQLDEIYPISRYAERFLAAYPQAKPGQLIIQRLGVPQVPAPQRNLSTPLRILSCSHLGPYKRIDLMMDSLQVAAKTGMAIEWTHLGEANPERLAAAKQRCAELCPELKVTFTGHLNNQDLPRYYADQKFHFFMNTSDSEGVPVTVMEALSAGLPVIATAAGGTGELVRHQKNGLLLPVDSSPAQIGKALVQLGQLPTSTYAAWCSAAVKTWEKYADAQQQYRTFADHLEKLSWEATRHE